MRSIKVLTIGMVLLMPTLAWAEGFVIDIEKNVNLQLGTKNFGPMAVDDDVTHVRITIGRSTWQDADALLTANLLVSVNNAPFRDWIGVTAHGTLTNPRGDVTAVGANLPPGTNRRVQGNYTVSGARFRTTITVIGEAR